mmetsp:Transcript_37518/g.74468  ORF Transcript_37518/g.74468 Transcript_37518/m.74468 type:complete len:347 (-) Transcript_37518:146-1186(-)
MMRSAVVLFSFLVALALILSVWPQHVQRGFKLCCSSLVTVPLERPNGAYNGAYNSRDGRGNATWLNLGKGTRVHNGSIVHNNVGRSDIGGTLPSKVHVGGTPPPKIQVLLGDLRIVLLITTQFSHKDIQFLERCWPSAIKNSAILANADIFVMASGRPPQGLLGALFRGMKLTVKFHSNLGPQAKATDAVRLAMHSKQLVKYDWLIRVNPDVLILEDEWLVRTMHDRQVDGIFADCLYQNCSRNCTRALVHTDFFAVRPRSVNFENFHAMNGNAETIATKVFNKIIRSGHDRWLPDARRSKNLGKNNGTRGACHVSGGPHVPVLHAHSLVKQCPLRRGEPKDRYLD